MTVGRCVQPAALTAAKQDRPSENTVLPGLRCCLAHAATAVRVKPARSEEHTSELQSLMRISYAVFCLKKKKTKKQQSRTRSETLQTMYIINTYTLYSVKSKQADALIIITV